MARLLELLNGASRASLPFQGNLCQVIFDYHKDDDDHYDYEDDVMTMMLALNDRHVRLASTNTVSRSLSLDDNCPTEDAMTIIIIFKFSTRFPSSSFINIIMIMIFAQHDPHYHLNDRKLSRHAFICRSGYRRRHCTSVTGLDGDDDNDDDGGDEHGVGGDDYEQIGDLHH